MATPTVLRAKYPYEARKADELSFAKRELLVLVSREGASGWWTCANAAGAKGLCPANYLTEVQTAAPVAPAPAPAAAPAEEPKDVATPLAAPAAAPRHESSAPPPTSAGSSGADALASVEAMLLAELAAEAAAREADVPTDASVVEAAPAVSDWKARALAAEEQLRLLMRTVEQDMQEADERLRRANDRTRRLEDEIVEQESALRLEREEQERLHVANMEVWKNSLEAAEQRVAVLEAAQGGTKELDSVVARLQRELSETRDELARVRQEKSEVSSSLARQSGRVDVELEQERARHAEAVQRATELHDMYESAREALAAQESAYRDLKRKTARLVELAQNQKRDESDANTVQRQQRRIEELMARVEELEDRQRAGSSGPASAPSAPPAPPAAPVFAPAPPPPPAPRAPAPTIKVSTGGGSDGGPTCPKCRRKFGDFDSFYGHEPCPGASAGGMMAQIAGGVALKKTEPPAAKSKPGVVEKKAGAFGNFAEVAAKVAKERAERQAQQRDGDEDRHRKVERVIANIRTSQRASGAW